MSHVRSEPLTAGELRHYREQGYVHLGRVMDDATLGALRDEEARFRGEAARESTIFISQLLHYSEPLRKYMSTGPQVKLASQLVGSPNIALWFNQYVTKLPDVASGKSEFPWHQDNGYVAINPATNVTIWVALDDVDERNGCVWVMPESHKQGLLSHKAKNTDSWHLTLDVNGDGIPAKLKAGEAIAFTGLTLHRSKLNHTDRPRRAFFMEYADVASTFTRGEQPPQSILKESNTMVVMGAAAWPRPSGLQ
jgi:phytanoyl-CoA hydroxylase